MNSMTSSLTFGISSSSQSSWSRDTVPQALSMKNMVEVQEVLSKFKNLKHVFCGHYHSDFEEKFDDITVHVAPATQMQIAPDRPYFKLKSDKPGWLVINWDKNTVETKVHY